MILEVYAGKRKIISLVQHYIPIESKAGAFIFKAQRGFVAIPGGNVRDEKTVRRWANEQGYKINKIYEAGIDSLIGVDDETTLPVS